MKGFFGDEETHSEAHRERLSTKQREDSGSGDPVFLETPVFKDL